MFYMYPTYWQNSQICHNQNHDYILNLRAPFRSSDSPCARARQFAETRKKSQPSINTGTSNSYSFRDTVNIMKFWTPLLMIFLCMVLLSVLGGVKERHSSRGDLFLQECWGDPTIRECKNRCSKNFRCVKINHTCCWTYCGNICWENTLITEEAKTLASH
ncbi:PREDICTED: protein WFDC11 [Capra hircus]|nr:PREDICTED: protein WFDC11 [Capra hircus]